MNITVNYLALLVAAIGGMVVGFIWYGPLCGKTWMKLKGYTKESMEKEKKTMGKWYALTFVLSIIEAYILSHVITMSMAYFHTAPVATGLTTGFWMWLGFILPTMVAMTIFGTKDKNFKLLSIDAGYQLAMVLVMGLVIAYMG